MDIAGGNGMEAEVLGCLLAACIMAGLVGMGAASAVTSEFTVNTVGDSKATMSYYTQLKGSPSGTFGDISGSSDDQGDDDMSTGTSNYLVNGRINFHDRVDYNDGRNSGHGSVPMESSDIPSTSPYLNHDLQVSFDGEEGISELSGKGSMTSRINQTYGYEGATTSDGDHGPNWNANVTDEALDTQKALRRDLWPSINQDRVFKCI